MGIKVIFEYTDKVNYAVQQQQSKEPILKKLVLVNDGEEFYENLMLRIESKPEDLFLPCSLPIDRLDADFSLDLTKEVSLLLNPEYLAKLTEKMIGALQISVSCKDEELMCESKPITALSYSEWNAQPYLLPTFITPNNADLTPLLHRAMDILKVKVMKYNPSISPSFSGYQHQDPNLIKLMAASIFQSIWESKIVYSALPPSFEKVGQKIRMVSTVLQEKFANCIDFTLLFASALEAIDLHPLLIGVPGHIFCGVWLEEKTFSNVITEDVGDLLSRTGEGNHQLLVFECTLMRDGISAPDFDGACHHAVNQLRTEKMQYCVDVKAARHAGVHALPEVQEVDGRLELKIPNQPSGDVSTDEIITFEDDSKPKEYDKMGMWEASLLNAGDLRNTLLNHKYAKKNLPLLAENLPALVQAINTGNSFTIHAMEESLSIDNFSELAATKNASLFNADLVNNRLRTPLSEKDLDKTLKDLYVQRNSVLEQTGTNTLYLSLGHLKWADKKASKKDLYAPLILVPLDVEYKSNIYRFRFREDEITLNDTIIERLRSEFRLDMPTWEQLPVEDDGSVDVRKILAIVRKATAEQHGWTVEETATITHFGFAKFNMWRDLHENGELISCHRMIDSLLKGKLSNEIDHEAFSEDIPENTLLVPLRVDGSQMFAIEKALEGHSFVLHGPPGTGKSQTISAIIGAAITAGKKVLLISEKPVALRVPQQRLESIGFGPYCLELHSDKGQIQQILKKYSDLIEMANTAVDPQKRQEQESNQKLFEVQKTRYSELAEELDQYVDALHAPRTGGKDLYTLIGEYSELPDGVFFPDECLSITTDPMLQAQQEELMTRLAALLQTFGSPEDRSLLHTGLKELSPSEVDNIRNSLTRYKELLSELKNALCEFCFAYRLDAGFDSASIEEHINTATLLQRWNKFPKEWIEGNIEEIKTAMEQLVSALAIEERMREYLSSAWTPAFLEADGVALANEYNDLSNNIFTRAVKYYALVNKLSKLRHNDVKKWKLTDTQMAEAIDRLCKYQHARKQANEILSANPLLEKYLAENCHSSAVVADQMESLSLCRKQLGHLCEIPADSKQTASINNVIDVHNNLQVCRDCLDEALQREKSNTDWNIDHELEIAEDMLAELKSVREWNAFSRACDEAKELGLDAVVQKMSEDCDATAVITGFRKSTCRKMINDIINSDSALSQFTGVEFNNKIQNYKKLDESLMPLAQLCSCYILEDRARNAVADAAHSGNELTILNKAIASQGKNTSVRKLFAAAGSLLLEMTPCLMMSPLSVSKYLPMELDMFDLVVFDEASQMTTPDAISCIARGKNCIICGDSRQMPPTSFFTSGTQVDDDHLELQDMESILDDCLALNMPSTHLKWHYRSNHESLITFSNKNFYDEKLLTFPSATDKNSHVHLQIVESGCFDWGKSKCNIPEADAVIEHLKHMSQQPEYHNQSVAVITSNVNQQDLLENKLMHARKNDSVLSCWLDNAREPLLIQNLENIQGHERDVVLFSLGYGPDDTGKIIQNFGPLNREGGWRRFNVAITRACEEFVIFSSIHPDQIKITPTTSRGVIALQQFLRFAATGELTTTANQHGSSESGIAKDIISALKEAGYDAIENLGHSHLRVDIAVPDPDRPNQFLLGILLDGDGYSYAKSTRDRELGHIEVLTSLGWNLIRIWSVDYWANQDSKRHITQILDKLEYLQKQKQKASE